MMTPLDAINADPPNVWITYADGFEPEVWGFTGFTRENMRDSFVRRSEPGVLLVHVGSKHAGPELQGRVIGVMQFSHEVGRDRDYMPVDAYAEKESSERSAGKWTHAVRGVRAWRPLPHSRPLFENFAPVAYDPAAVRAIGAWGKPLTYADAQNLLSLDLEEVEVFGQSPVVGRSPGPGVEVLKPSQPGPVSQMPVEHREAEGPCHIYVLALSGKAAIFLNDPAARGIIIKAGFSKVPEDRMEAHNRHLPVGPFQWSVLKSTEAEGRPAFPGSIQGKAAEATMMAMLARDARSLGREFFLADDGAIEAAWKAGIEAGEKA
ncbi:hypothetical protein U5922_007535 [Aquicoccus sp. G2-2]|uniref:hypothetical protein n=1 Tax=Aquicoccus sp. G2-2 TaxID=3092120 RepID=UPI002ADFE98B|nr:hypothetical protein [Aquicoccus sp. G2-2]MEA1113335.1 hypothetical protein [Aquicoccus sp. G2-2]